MPIYAFKCGCGHTFEDFKKMSEAPPDCPVCHGMCHIVPGKFTTRREWHGEEAVSQMLQFAPGSEAEVAKDIPSIKLNCRGQVVFTDDAHQRRVYREMAEAKRRHEEQMPQPERDDGSDVRAAAAEISEKFGVANAS